jgi:hypothetical protein
MGIGGGENSNATGVLGVSRDPRSETKKKRSPGRGMGVIGASEHGDGAGVVGVSFKSIASVDIPLRGGFERAADGDGIGVRGASGTGSGLFGISFAGSGVQGHSQDDDGTVGVSDANGKSGVFGFNSKREGLAFGVFGRCDSAQGSGISGRNDSTGDAVSGFSSKGVGVSGSGKVGVRGESAEAIVAGRVGVLGTCKGLGVGVHGISKGLAGVGVRAESTDGGIALFAEDKGNAGLAGFFRGDVRVAGNFIVFGSKSAAVPHPDGSHRLLYCVESPESWFEDFGEGRLVDGKAEVRLDPDFAAVIKSNKYHVFVTPYGNSNGLYVTHRNSNGFRVQEQNGGRSRLTFSYRVVAKRKGIKAERLARVTLPEHPTSRVPKQPRKPVSKR